MHYFNMFKHFLYIIAITDKCGVFKWILGQESNPNAFCLGVTFQRQNKVHIVYLSEINNAVHLSHALFSFAAFCHNWI